MVLLATSLSRRCAPLLRVAPLVAVLLLSLALAIGWAGVSAQTAHAAAANASSGVISGTLVNGTHNNAGIPNQKMTLQLSIGTAPKDVATTTTDAQGHFTFTAVTPTVSTDENYAVYTDFQGGLYSSGPVTVAAGASQHVVVTAYVATQSDAHLGVSVATVLFSKPTQLTGMIHIGEFLTFTNTGNTSFVGSASPSNGMPMGLLRFSLPPNATNLTTGVGFFNSGIIQVNSGFASTATVPPGQSQFAFTFEVPYTGHDYTFAYKAEYPTAQVVALVPPDTLVENSPGMQAQGIVNAFGARYQVFAHNNATSATQMSIHLWDLPTPGEQQYLNAQQLQLVVGILASVIFLLLVVYLLRGDLAVALGLVPAQALAQSRKREALEMKSARRASATQRESARKRLLQQLLSLEKSHASGDLPDGAFREQAAQIRAELRALIARDAPPSAMAPTKISRRAGVDSAESASEASGDSASASASARRIDTTSAVSGGPR